MTNWLSRLKSGLKKSSDKLSGGISDIFTKRRIDAETLDELEELLIISDIGYKAASAVIKNFAAQKMDKDISEEEIKEALADNIAKILKPCEQNFVLSAAKPNVILMVGVNGAGKTTAIGKLAHKFKDKKISLIAGDTFRAAAVEQLKIWGERNGVRVYSGAPNCDAAGLCFDGLTEAVRQGDEIVFIDTAGRLQNKSNLTEELKKVIRVIKKVIPEAPHHTLLCVDAATGQNILEQIKVFKEVAGVNGLIMNKLDGTAKGGILVASVYETPLPVYYVGVGEGIEDLQPFNAIDFSKSLLGLD